MDIEERWWDDEGIHTATTGKSGGQCWIVFYGFSQFLFCTCVGIDFFF